MTPRSYLRRALVAPVAVALPAFLLARSLGDPFGAVGQVLVGALFAAVVPYLLSSIAFATWIRGRPPQAVERAAWLAPLLFLVPYIGYLLLIAAATGALDALGLVAGLSGFMLAIGYGYVAAAMALYHQLERRGVIDPWGV